MATKESKVSKAVRQCNGPKLSVPSLKAIVVTQSIKMLNKHGIIRIIVNIATKTCKTTREKE